jgi:hypothetical protein
MTTANSGTDAQAPSLEDRRQQIIDQLTERYANGALEVDDFERQLEQVQRVATQEELERVAADLVPTAAQKAPEPPAYEPARASSASVPRRRSLLAVLGKVRRQKTWTVPRQLNVVSVMGGVDLDFREAEFGPGVTEVRVTSLMGGVKVIVPPGLPVEVEGSGIMGGFDGYNEPKDPSMTDPDAPLLRITGVALMGGLRVQVLRPGETAQEAAGRMREEERRRREEQRRATGR